MAFGAWFAPSWCSQKEEKQGVAVLRLVVVLLLLLYTTTTTTLVYEKTEETKEIRRENGSTKNV